MSDSDKLLLLNDRLKQAVRAFEGLSMRDSLDILANIMKWLVVRDAGESISMSWLEFGALTVELSESYPDSLIVAVAKQANLIAYWLSIK
jgi:hypothetical protein